LCKQKQKIMRNIFEEVEKSLGYDVEKKKQYEESLMMTFDDGTTAIRAVASNEVPEGISFESDVLNGESFLNADQDLKTYVGLLQLDRMQLALENERLKHQVEKLQDLIDKNIGKIG